MSADQVFTVTTKSLTDKLQSQYFSITTMKFFIFDGDEERFLLDRLKELNRNFDKETRIKFLKSEIRKREKILRKRWRRHR